MLICPILSPYFSGPWSWTEYQCQNDHALVVCAQVDALSGGIRLSSLVLAGLMIANENVNLPYFGGPWKDYHCHSETTGNYQFGVQYRPMRLPNFWSSTSNTKFCSCRANNDYHSNTYIKQEFGELLKVSKK